MAHNFVFLDYTFLFDSNDTWQHLHQFEGDLSKFFAERGFQAEVIKTVEGQIGKRILLIKRIDDFDKFPEKENLQVGIKRKISNMEKDGKTSKKMGG